MPPRVLHYSDVENAYDTPERVARLAGLVTDRRGPDALVAGSGDDTGPGVLSLVTDGMQSLDLFDAVSPHVETVGNHDLDNGFGALRTVVRESPQQWVLANATLDGQPFGADVGVEPGATFDLRGATVGAVGVLDPATPEMTPGTDALDFEDPLPAAAREESRLREAGADYVVALAHTTDDDARALARETDVDAVLAGHSHERDDAVVDGTPFTRPGATGQYVYEVDLGTGDVQCHATDAADPVESVERALTDRIDAAGLDEVVAHVSDPLARDRERRLAGEWRLGNFVADAYRWKTGADVGLQNAGGVREGPPLVDDVTVADLIGVSPFEEPVVVASVTGAELRALVHEADGRNVEGLPDRWYGHVSGMEIAAVDGRHEPFVDGEAVDPEARYTVATPNFLLLTDREFPTLTESHRVASGDLQYEIVVDYAREFGIDPEIERRLPEGVGRE